jgi:hypothetical protein
MGQIVGGEKVGFRRVIENIVAGIDAGVKMSVDQPRRDKTTLGVDLLVHGLRIFLADELYSIAVEYHDTLFDDFMFFAVEANDITPLDHRSHISDSFKLDFGYGQD